MARPVGSQDARRRQLRRARRPVALLGTLVLVAGVIAGCGSSSKGSNAGGSGRVLLVGTYRGHAGRYSSIQAAVDAAKPGDWILVAPGDYHETADRTPTNVDQGGFGGVLITTPDIHLRGMDRATVMVDGTKPGGAPCSAAPAQQTFGASGTGVPASSGYGSASTSSPAGTAVGRNGIVVYRANGVSIDNLTVCNFLAGTGRRRATRSGGTAAPTPASSGCRGTRAAT